MKKTVFRYTLLLVALLLAVLCILSLTACSEEGANIPNTPPVTDTTPGGTTEPTAPATYTAVFLADGVLVGTETFTADNMVVEAPPVPEKEGYIATWEKYSLTAADVLINAVYIDARITLTLTEDQNAYVVEKVAADVEEAVLPDYLHNLPVIGIGEKALYCCDKLTSVTIPDTITSIGSMAFVECFGLTSVTIPSSVKSIGFSAFYGCKNLTSVTFCEGLAEIGSYAFSKCAKLTSITFPASVSCLDRHIFAACPGLTSISFTDPTSWYCTDDKLVWTNRADGSPIDLSDAEEAAYYLVDYDRYYYYKL